MPIASTNPTLNAVVHEVGKPFRPADYFSSLLGALRRMEQLIQEAVVTVPRALIAETIDLIAVLAGRGSERRLIELAKVTGLAPAGDYALDDLLTPETGDDS